MKLTFFKSLTTLGLGLLLSSVFVNAAKADVIDSLKNADKSLLEITNDEPLLLSQLRGHEVYMGYEQMEWDNKMLGHVRGKTGTIAHIVLPDGSSLRATTDACDGDDVLIGEDDDGNYYFIGVAHPRWISILEEDYGWKRLDYASYRPLTERTADLWAQLESSPTTRTAIPPRRTVAPSRPYTPPPQPAPAPEPVRGLW